MEMKFETLLIVRPTPRGGRYRRFVAAAHCSTRSAAAVLEIMLPAQIQAMRPKTAALAILTAAERTPPGVHVIGARELSAIVAETMPALLPKRPRLR